MEGREYGKFLKFYKKLIVNLEFKFLLKIFFKYEGEMKIFLDKK